jgi:hypothetical protein
MTVAICWPNWIQAGPGDHCDQHQPDEYLRDADRRRRQRHHPREA